MLRAMFFIIVTLFAGAMISAFALGEKTWLERPAALLFDIWALGIAMCGIVLGVILLIATNP